MKAVGSKFKEKLVIMIGSITITMVVRKITKIYQVKNSTLRQKIVNGMAMQLVIIEGCFPCYFIFQIEELVYISDKINS